MSAADIAIAYQQSRTRPNGGVAAQLQLADTLADQTLELWERYLLVTSQLDEVDAALRSWHERDQHEQDQAAAPHSPVYGNYQEGLS